MNTSDKILPSVQEAIDICIQHITPISDIINISIENALGFTLAADVISHIDVPSFDNSAVDGFAVNTEDLKNKRIFEISQRLPAGTNPSLLKAGTAAKIFTGAPVPARADTVIMLEDCIENDGMVQLPDHVISGKNIRPRAQDVTKGTVIVKKGHKLTPQDIGLIASIGVKTIDAYRPLKIAVISTGSELLEPGDIHAEGKIYNSNRFMLQSVCKSFNFDFIDMGMTNDDYESTAELIMNAAENADAVITTGGVSISDEDYVKRILSEFGEQILWKVAIKPGKPFAFGLIKNTPVIGLPGNPSAAFVTALVLGKEILYKLQGTHGIELVNYLLPINFSVNKSNARRSYLHCRVVQTAKGPALEKFTNQSSGMLSSISWASGLGIIRENEKPQGGDLIEYISFADLLN